MSKFRATVVYDIDSDELEAEHITAYFDNQGNESVKVEVYDDDLEDGVGDMVITSADATVEVVEY